MAQCLFICNINLSIEDLSIVLVKEYDLKTHIKGYHAYMTKWTPKNGEILKAPPEPENTSMTNMQSQLNNVVMWLDILLKESLHVSQKPFCIFYVQAMKTAVELKSRAKE